MRRHVGSDRRWMSAALWLLTMALASRAEAQGIAASFDQLRLLVRPGDTVSVTDTTGREVTGKIVALSSSSLALTIDRTRRELTEPDVTTIRQRRNDSLANGAKWGLGVGVCLPLVLLALSGADDIDAGFTAVVIAAYGGMGAGIGVGIDAMITGRQVIYERPARSAATLTISPMLTDTRKGVSVSMRF
jgi:hypothetical protein